MKLFLAIAILLASYGVAFAGKPPPIRINKCVMGSERGGDISIIGEGVDFTNISHHVMTSVRFNFTFLSQSNDILGGTLQTDTGNFSPGIEIDHTKAHQPLFPGVGDPLSYWQSHNPSDQPATMLKLSCSVDAISWADGNVWSAHR
jgi:hypothetical protein